MSGNCPVDAEQLVRQLLHEQSVILDSAIVGIIKVQDRCIIWANRAFETMMGCAPGACLGTPTQQYYTSEAAYQAMGQRAYAAMQGGDAYRTEQQYVRPDGSLLWADVSCAVIDADKGISVGAFLDITARKQAEEALRIAAIAFESQEGMFVTDAERVILRVNRAFTSITGYSAQDAVGQKPRLLSSGRHDADFYAAMQASLQLHGSWQGEIWNRRKSGELYPEWLTITAVKDAAGALQNYVASFVDVSLKKASEDQIRHLAFYDPLTGLPNRRLLLDRLEHALAARSRSGCEGALLLIDLDNFKDLNDNLGHHIGDQLLQHVGQRILACVGEEDTVARFGGDEYVVIMQSLHQDAQEMAKLAESTARQILEVLNQPFRLGGYSHHNTASIGITLFADHHDTMEELLKQADLAMYEAKSAGRNTLRFFNPLMQAAVAARASLEAGLRAAVLQQQFCLYYQAQVEGCSTLRGAEALVRWLHPQCGLISPAEFIPLAEETGLILPIGQWVLQAACEQLAVWAGQPQMADLTLSVNVSARQFRQADFVAGVLDVVRQSGADPQRLKLELTESLLVSDVETTIAKMVELKKNGIGFSLDDFGTGYSSLSYLKRLPLDQLKIDQGFVRDCLSDPNDAAIARMVIALAGSLGLVVVAEGVETEAQRQFLEDEGCRNYQGYLFSRPLPLADFEALALSYAAART
jgi:diguanylate cyclase (GGDEF)-like protein/PAS domain S-box-containing protein